MEGHRAAVSHGKPHVPQRASGSHVDSRVPLDLLLLAWPPVLSAAFVFVRQAPRTGRSVLFSSLGLAAVNATAEELLWRGAYVARFPESRVFGWLYPAVGFGLWHLAPQAVHPSKRPGGAWSFVVAALVAGLGYGWVARRRRSIRWTVPFHILWDFMGLGGRIYFD